MYAIIPSFLLLFAIFIATDKISRLLEYSLFNMPQWIWILSFFHTRQSISLNFKQL